MMVSNIQRFVLASCLPTLFVGGVAEAQAVRLPISEGVWVKTDTRCEAATNVFAYGGGRFGSVYFYGPDQGMGPSNETEPLTRVGRGQDGFSVVNEGPLEVAARPNGQAVVRAYSPSGGVQWSDAVRLCPAATLPAKMRDAIVRMGLSAGAAAKP
jgi:hypothetical protein